MKEHFIKLDEKVFKLTLLIEKIALFISFCGIAGLYIFLKYYVDIKLYYISISIFQAGLTAGVFSICCAIFFNKLKKER